MEKQQLEIGIVCPFKGRISIYECKKCLKCFSSFAIDFFIDNYINYKKEHTGISVSQLSNCLRKAYYESLSYYTTPQALNSAVFGTIVHYGMAFYFRQKEGYLSEYKIDKFLNPDIKITGTIDLYSYKTQTLYDFKTSYSIYDKYKKQLNIYRKMFHEPVKRLRIVLINKQIKTVDINFEDIDIDTRAYILYNSIKDKKLPPKETNSDCKYCIFYKECSIDSPEIKF